MLFATHLTSIYDRALDDRLLHEVEHAAYLLAAWRCGRPCSVSGAAPPWPASAAVFGVIAGGALLGMILLAATEPLMPTYAARLGAERALDDQRTAAAMMWVTGMLTTLPLLVVAVWRWASAEERIARRAEALAERYGDPAEAARRSSVASAPPVTVTAVTSSPWPSSTQHVPAVSSWNSAAVT